MPRRRSSTFTEVELEFMHVLWVAGEATTDGVLTALRRQGRRLSDGSIRKVLAILLEKGHVTRRREGRGYVYMPKVPRAKARRRMVSDLLRRAFGGSAALMVASLLDADAVTDDEIAEIKRLIANREGEKGQ